MLIQNIPFIFLYIYINIRSHIQMFIFYLYGSKCVSLDDYELSDVLKDKVANYNSGPNAKMYVFNRKMSF